MRIRLPLLCLFLATAAFATEPASPSASSSFPPAAPAPKDKTFLIILRPVPPLHDEKAWTDADNAAVGQHFLRLKEATARGQVILAGRTEEPPDRTFGLVVFSAASEAAAREFMNADPCVAGGVMTAELHPYALALLKKFPAVPPSP